VNFIKENKVVIISIIAIIIMLLSVFFWNHISKKQKTDEDTTNNTVDVSDADNVDIIDNKLGEDLQITQSYLLNYTRRKSTIWYMSEGSISSVSKDNKYSTIIIKDDDGNSLVTSIANDKCNVKKNDHVYFVGTIDLASSSLELSKISLDKIDYKNVTEITLKDLVNNIKLVKDNYFIISGYMVTDGTKYKLFDSKNSYSKDSSAGSYFLISWKDEFNYTGNKGVTIKCKLEDTYKLNECILKE